MSSIRTRVDQFVAARRETIPKHWHDVQPPPGSREEREFQFLPVIHFLCRDGTEQVVGCPLRDGIQKDAVAATMKVFAEKLDAIAVALITEAWMVDDDGTDVAPRDRPDRREVLLVTIETVLACHSMAWDIKREEGRAPQLHMRAFETTDPESRFFGAIAKLN